MGKKKSKSRKGKGIINKIINNLPFEAHVPGYRFLGPGTDIDKRINQPGINPLDDAAKEHDIAYKNSNNLTDRHIADKILENKAWERVKAKDAAFFGEKVPAWFTTTLIKLKRKIGAGKKKMNKQKKMKKRVKKNKKIKFSTLVAKARAGLNPSNSLEQNIMQSMENVKKFQDVSVTRPKRIIPLPKQGGFLPLVPVAAALASLGGIGFSVKQIADAVSAVNNARKNLMGSGIKKGGALYLDINEHTPRRGRGKMYVKRNKTGRGFNLHL